MPKRPEWCPLFLKALREGTVGPCMAAELAGVHKTTPYSYAADHPDFRAEWEDAEDQGRQAREADRERRYRRQLARLGLI